MNAIRSRWLATHKVGQRQRGCRQQTQDSREAPAGDGRPQQPTDVVARCMWHCMQPDAEFSLQVAAVHPVIRQ